MKYILVPQHDIDKIEQARLELWELADKCESLEFNSDIMLITQKLWSVSHRKYKEIEVEP